MKGELDEVTPKVEIPNEIEFAQMQADVLTKAKAFGFNVDYLNLTPENIKFVNKTHSAH